MFRARSLLLRAAPRLLLRHCSASAASSAAESGVTPLRLSPNMLCHIGNACAVVALGQTDMLNLRACMVAASSCGIAFNLLQPTPLWVPAGWGAFFVAGHCTMIGLLLRERQAVAMSEREMDAYEETFHRHSFTPRQFKRLLEAGEWRDVAPGEAVTRQGGAKEHVHYVHRGRCEVTVSCADHSGSESLGTVGAASRFIGTLRPAGAREREGEGAQATWPVSVTASTPCVLLSWRAAAIEEVLRDDPKMEAAAASTAIIDLSRKLRSAAARSAAAHARGSAEAYRALLALATADGYVDGSEKKLLREYRSTHALSREAHVAALAALGWSEQEYDDGRLQPTHGAVAEYRRMLVRALEDGRVGGAEKRALRLFRAAHGLDGEMHRRLLAEHQWTAEEFDDGARHHEGELPEAPPRRGLLRGLLSALWHG